MNYRSDIDGLRAIAVLAVVVYHAFPQTLSGGFAGVDVFFVLSGFLITGIVLADVKAERFTYADFYARRALRLLPALTIVMASTLAAGWWFMFPSEYAALGRHGGAAALFGANLLSWSQAGYFDAAAHTQPFLHLWSLSVEEQFYLVWPVWLVLIGQRSARLPWTALLVLASALVSAWMTVRVPEAAYFLPWSRAWELGCGALLALWMDRSADRAHLHPLWSWVGLLAIGASFFWIDSGSRFPMPWALLPVAGTMLVLATGTQCGAPHRLLAWKPLVQLGLASYAWYLWHWPLLVWVHLQIGSDAPAGWRVAAVALSAGLALISQRWLEHPIRTGRRSPAKVALVCAGFVLVALASGLVWTSGGMPQRDAVQGLSDPAAALQRSPRKDSACLAEVGQPKVPYAYCRWFEAQSDRTVAVVGDSHAHALVEAWAERWTTQGWNVVLLANSGCPSIQGFEAGVGEAARALCRRETELLLTDLERVRGVSEVWWVARGPVYWERPPGSQEAYWEAIHRTVERWVARGWQVHLLTENVWLKRSITDCLPRPGRCGSDTCPLSAEEARSALGPYVQQMQAMRDRLPSVRVWDGTAPFCSGTPQCRQSDEQGTALYTDDDHLSLAGARWLRRQLLGTEVVDEQR